MRCVINLNIYAKGEVVVQRLNLQVLWVQPPPFENAKVCGIGWRPDERILAIGKYLLKINYAIGIGIELFLCV